MKIIIIILALVVLQGQVVAHHLPQATLATRGYAIEMLAPRTTEQNLVRPRFGRILRPEQVLTYTEARRMIFQATRGQKALFLPVQLPEHRRASITRTRFRQILEP